VGSSTDCPLSLLPKYGLAGVCYFVCFVRVYRYLIIFQSAVVGCDAVGHD